MFDQSFKWMPCFKATFKAWTKSCAPGSFIDTQLLMKGAHFITVMYAVFGNFNSSLCTMSRIISLFIVLSAFIDKVSIII